MILYNLNMFPPLFASPRIELRDFSLQIILTIVDDPDASLWHSAVVLWLPSLKVETKENQSLKGNMWSAIPIALLCMLVIVGDG